MRLKSTSVAAAVFAAFLLCGADLLLEKARSGDIRSQLLLASEYIRGSAVRKPNHNLAVYWFRRAADAGSPVAQYNLATCFLNGWGCKKNPAAAFSLFKKAMGAGIKKAAVQYAKMLAAGVEAGEFENEYLSEVKPDEAAAISILEHHTLADDPDALLFLAKYYFRNVKKHGHKLRKMLKLYADSVKDPDPEALVIYAACLRSGIGGFPPDPQEGAKILKRAADMKHPEATAQLAEMLYYGFGMKQNKKQALLMISSAIAAGSTRAMVFLGESKLAGVDIPHDPDGAFQLFSQAAKLKYPPALRKVADCYAYGIGIEKDTRIAIAYYRNAAASGDMPAAVKLGEWFRSGTNTPVNHTAAFQYFYMAAQADDPAGLRETGLALLEGRGVPKDTAKAAAYLKRAADSGDLRAAAILR